MQMFISETETAKQNQKFPFHFLSALTHLPPRKIRKVRKNFWFLLARPPHQSKLGAGQAPGADEARRLVLARIVLVKSSDFVQETQPPIKICFFAKIRSVAKRRDRGFRE